MGWRVPRRSWPEVCRPTGGVPTWSGRRSATTPRISCTRGRVSRFFNDGALTLDGSTRIVENTTIDGGGGGVYNAGVLTLDGASRISANIGGEYGSGGVWNDEGGTLTLNDRSAISRNVSDGPGGGVNNEGYSTLTLNDASAIVGNRTRSTGWDGEGGGVWNQGHLAMHDSSCICDNHARSDGGGVRNIFLWSGDKPLGSFTMAPTSSIAANTARGEGGGILTVDDPSAFSGVVCGGAGDANVDRNGPDDCLYRKASGAIGDWPGDGEAPPATAQTIPRVEVDLPGSVGVIDHDVPPAEPSLPDPGAPPVATSADLTPSGAERVLPRSSSVPGSWKPSGSRSTPRPSSAPTSLPAGRTRSGRPRWRRATSSRSGNPPATSRLTSTSSWARSRRMASTSAASGRGVP